MNDISLKGKKWLSRGRRSQEESLYDAFCRVRNYEESFLRPGYLEDLASPYDFPDMSKAVERIFRAIRDEEEILLFGDFDLDGASGVAILYLTLKQLGGRVRAKLPSREEGYGLNREIIKNMQKHKMSLLISVDCGVSNASEIALGKELGLDSIVVDHHSLPIQLPEAVAIIHPHLLKRDSDLHDLTGAGAAFFLAMALLRKKFPDNHKHVLRQLLELAALGTIADLGELRGQNRLIVALGIEAIKKSEHPGINKLLKNAGIKSETVTAETIAFFLAPRLNSSGRLDHPHISLKVLLGDAENANILEDLNKQRRVVAQQCSDIAFDLVDETEACIFAFHERFFSGISGLVASSLTDRFNKPAIVFAEKDNETLVASCRGPEDFHFREALGQISDSLESFGGHKMAAGFAIKKSKLADFKKNFNHLVESIRGENPAQPSLIYDFSVAQSDLCLQSFSNIFSLAPFGQGNPAPIFHLPSAQLTDIRVIGKDKNHLSGKLFSQIPFVFFFATDLIHHAQEGSQLDLLIEPEESNWSGKSQLKVKIVDLKF